MDAQAKGPNGGGGTIKNSTLYDSAVGISSYTKAGMSYFWQIHKYSCISMYKGNDSAAEWVKCLQLNFWQQLLNQNDNVKVEIWKMFI